MRLYPVSEFMVNSVVARKAIARDIRIIASAMVLLSLIAIVVSLYLLRPVLVPFVLALFLASGLAPLVTKLERELDTSRWMALLVALVLSVAVTTVLCLVLGYSVKQLTARAPAYLDRLDVIYEHTVAPWLPEDFLVPPVDGEANEVAAPVPGEPALDLNIDAQDREAAIDQPGDSAHPAQDFIQQQLRANSMWLINTTSGGLSELLATGLLVAIFLFFLLLSSAIEVPHNSIWTDIETQVRSYIVTKSILSLLTGIAFGISLWLFNVPMAIVLGFLAVLLNFIPNIGAVITTLLPIPLLVLDPAFTSVAADGEVTWLWGRALTAFVVANSTQFILGNIVEPRVMGEQFKLHPVAVLLALIFWAMVWGIPGAFLAVPITSACKIILNEWERTRPAAQLLEGNLAMFARSKPVAQTV